VTPAERIAAALELLRELDCDPHLNLHNASDELLAAVEQLGPCSLHVGEDREKGEEWDVASGAQVTAFGRHRPRGGK
jgi:hypothetical protein